MKRSLILLLTALLVFSSLSSCRAEVPQSASFFLMDTVITVTLYTDEATARPILAECRALLEELDELWSRTKSGSDVSRYNEGDTGMISMDPRTVELLEVALEVFEATDGAFDVTVAPFVTLWKVCEEAGRLPSETELSLARSQIGSERLSLRDGGAFKSDRNMMIDLGGIGKGAAISRLIAYIESVGIRGALVSFGSNVVAIGNKPDGKDFRIALKDPKNDGSYACTLTLSSGEILSVSGDYERFYEIGGEKYHHILDPNTGYPSDSGLSSVAVVCRDGALADALSTAMLVMGEERARAFYASGVYEFEAVFISDTGILSTTDGITVQ